MEGYQGNFNDIKFLGLKWNYLEEIGVIWNCNLSGRSNFGVEESKEKEDTKNSSQLAYK